MKLIITLNLEKHKFKIKAILCSLCKECQIHTTTRLVSFMPKESSLQRQQILKVTVCHCVPLWIGNKSSATKQVLYSRKR